MQVFKNTFHHNLCMREINAWDIDKSISFRNGNVKAFMKKTKQIDSYPELALGE